MPPMRSGYVAGSSGKPPTEDPYAEAPPVTPSGGSSSYVPPSDQTFAAADDYYRNADGTYTYQAPSSAPTDPSPSQPAMYSPPSGSVSPAPSTMERSGYGSATSPVANTQPAMYSPPSGPVPKPASMYRPPIPDGTGSALPRNSWTPPGPTSTASNTRLPGRQELRPQQPVTPAYDARNVPEHGGIISTEQALDPKAEWALRLAALGLAAGTKGMARFDPTVEASLISPAGFDAAGNLIGQGAVTGTYGFEDIYGVPYPSTDRFHDWLNSVNGHGPGRTVTGSNGEPRVTRLPNSPTKNGTR